MATVSTDPSAPPLDWTVADLLDQLGGVPPRRVRMLPTPGTATEEDLLAAQARTGRICELVDGMLVEKVMGWYESAVALALGYFLKDYLRRRRTGGVVLAPDGLLRIMPRLVRVPDVAYINSKRLNVRQSRKKPILPLAPDLAVEVLSKGKTRAEMDRKLRDYFTAGVRLVWYIDPAARTALAYTAPDQRETVAEDGALVGGEVLPGFTLTLRELFAEAEGERPAGKAHRPARQ